MRRQDRRRFILTATRAVDLIGVRSSYRGIHERRNRTSRAVQKEKLSVSTARRFASGDRHRTEEMRPCQRWPRTHRTMSCAPRAPDCRAISRPPRNMSRVGILTIPKRAATVCSSSVFTLASRTWGSSVLAACSKAGAMIKHGPHQGAQKSTTTGMSFRVTWVSKVAFVNVIGCPTNNGPWHRPHLGPSPRRVPGTRLIPPQWGQTM